MAFAWQLFLYQSVISTTSTGQLDIGDFRSAEGCSPLKAIPATRPLIGDSNNSVTVLDGGLLGHHVDYVIFPRFQDDLDNNQEVEFLHQPEGHVA